MDTKIVHFVDDRHPTTYVFISYCGKIGDYLVTWDVDHVTCRDCLVKFKERMRHGN